MAFRFYRRVNLGKGLGLNISKSGVSSSIRTRFGSFGSKGYSFRTGISGLSYRRYFSSGKKGKNDALAFLLIVLLSFAIYVLAIIVWNALLLSIWLAARLWNILSEEYALFKTGERSNFAIIISLMLVLCMITLLLVWYYHTQFS